MNIIILFFIYLISVKAYNSQSIETCSTGSYKVEIEPFNECSGYRTCEQGYYCENEIRKPCPGGTYGLTSALDNPKCSGICPEGYYCPEGTIDPFSHPCGSSSYYCPKGSSRPIKIESGYYGIGNSTTTFSSQQICPEGSYCVNGVKYLCPIGTYGDRRGLNSSECSGICPEGYYCDVGTVYGNANVCGNSNVYCPKGSVKPLQIEKGYYGYGGKDEKRNTNKAICPIGYYCVNGNKYICPSGKYNDKEGSVECSGECEEGYYCPEGSIIGTMNKCGNNTVYCPKGSSFPLKVRNGYYSYGNDEYTRTSERICSKGYYCVDGRSVECPIGYYGNEEGLSYPYCSGKCPSGYICNNTATIEPIECGYSFDEDMNEIIGENRGYCPTGSYKHIVAPPGYYTVGGDSMTRTDIRICEEGHYCISGTKYICPKGSYGLTRGLSSSNCSGLCSRGYYCPDDGSIFNNTKDCGSVDLYCPFEGMTSPLKIPLGYYGYGGNNMTTKTNISICPLGHYCVNGEKYLCRSGYYGNESGLYNDECSGLCPGGYYCMEGTIIPKKCNDINKYCPIGSSNPQSVPIGYYSKNINNIEWNCDNNNDENNNRNDDSSKCGDISIRDGISICEEGHYCVNGIRYLCGCGYYGNSKGLTSIECNGKCLSGYYCLNGSIVNNEYKCGNANLYCESGSCGGVSVPIGSYSDESEDELLRSKYYNCEPGYYCVNGIRHKCLRGHYGSEYNESKSSCSGLCLSGYYCLEGSTSNKENECGDVSVYCPSGSFIPLKIPRGYYGIGNSEKTQYSYKKCEKGNWCVNGIKRKCLSGYYGNESGLYDEKCNGLCPGGYYCLEGTINNYNKCGSIEYYCPIGSSNRLKCPEGYYTVNVNSVILNVSEIETVNIEEEENEYELIRDEIRICEKGHYCVGGKMYNCSSGRYGNVNGLSDSLCSGLCPSGYYCIEGSVEPMKCERNSYSSMGSSSCINCLNVDDEEDSGEMLCQDSELCCYNRRKS